MAARVPVRASSSPSDSPTPPHELQEDVPLWQARVQAALEACGDQGDSFSDCEQWRRLQFGYPAAAALIQIQSEPIDSLKAICETLVSVFPDDGEPLWCLAFEHLRLGEQEEARRVAARAADMPVCYTMGLTAVRVRRFAREMGQQSGSLIESFLGIERPDLAASQLAEGDERVTVAQLLSMGLVKRAEQYVERAAPDEQIEGLAQLVEFYRERDPEKAAGLQRRIDLIQA